MPDPNKHHQEYITLSEAAALAPRPPTAGAVWRWARRGLPTSDGRRIHLRHVRVGGRVYTTEQWLHQFFEELAAADLANTRWQHADRTPCPQSPMTHEASDAALLEAGL